MAKVKVAIGSRSEKSKNLSCNCDSWKRTEYNNFKAFSGIEKSMSETRNYIWKLNQTSPKFHKWTEKYDQLGSTKHEIQSMLMPVVINIVK